MGYYYLVSMSLLIQVDEEVIKEFLIQWQQAVEPD
ncbi:hypothetical protein MIT1002_04145 (plasmid) [Alteromonas macleodii]|jgi:hypothetical protein|nr:hypothetical protein MIT1002_04145 [Alteromonas macleodii]VTP58052.1 hypothetical protein MIT1002_04145 [Alteromonas macleodii]|tara:strand:+ start:3524 stop:3628 length:105 start_codon:yes stop_codon:yes gene_type:complete